MLASNIIELIWTQIVQLYASYKLLLPKGKCPVDCLQFFNLPTATTIEKFRMIFWKKPLPNVIKLNVDGARKNNPGEVGTSGIFRESFGNLIMGFSSYLCTASSIMAEAKSLWLGFYFAR